MCIVVLPLSSSTAADIDQKSHAVQSQVKQESKIS